MISSFITLIGLSGWQSVDNKSMHTEPRNPACGTCVPRMVARSSHFTIHFTQIYIFTRVPVIATVIRLKNAHPHFNQ